MRSGLAVLLRSIRQLNLTKILRVLGLALRFPHFSLLGLYATLKSYSIAKQLFPKTNSSSGLGNAFRHALWTSLILMYCCKISSPRKALLYTKKFTDMHEEIFPNKPLETKMDLHNNQVGINLFKEMLKGIHRQFFEKSFLIDQLLEKTKTAVLLTELDQDLGDELVYLSE